MKNKMDVGLAIYEAKEKIKEVNIILNNILKDLKGGNENG
jgi:hypothetical protein